MKKRNGHSSDLFILLVCMAKRLIGITQESIKEWSPQKIRYQQILTLNFAWHAKISNETALLRSHKVKLHLSMRVEGRGQHWVHQTELCVDVINLDYLVLSAHSTIFLAHWPSSIFLVAEWLLRAHLW